jgi:UDP-2-acetamido-3-amino-2,3-dideoxy-glucuronate N-acetyltransferase
MEQNGHLTDTLYETMFQVKKEKAWYSHPTACIDTGCEIGEGTKIWHFSHVMPESKIGKNCSLGQNVFIAGGVTLGNNVKIQNNVSIYDGVICEDDVFLGPSMVFTNVINPRSGVNRKNEYKTTIVRKGVTIGANATIICGITIGAYAFIGAGATVTKNVKPYALMVGTPAKQSAWMSERGHKLLFDYTHTAVCPESNETYILVNNSVHKIKMNK